MRKTLLVAAGTLVLVAAGGFGIQALALGRPSAATLELVDTLHHLAEYHRSAASIVLGGRRYTSRCGQNWYRHARVAAAVVDGREVLAEVNDHLLTKGNVAHAQFELAACPHALATWLGSQLGNDARVSMQSTRADGRRVVELRLPGAKPPLVVYVETKTALPVGLQLAGRHMRGSSDVSFGNVQ